MWCYVSVDLKPTQWEGWVFEWLRGGRGQGRAVSYISKHLGWGPDSFSGPVSSGLLSFCSYTVSICSMTVSHPDRARPRGRALLETKREKEWRRGPRVSQLPITKIRLLCVAGLWLGNLGSHEAVRPDRNLQLVVFGINWPGRTQGTRDWKCPGVLPWPAAHKVLCLPKSQWRTSCFVWIVKSPVKLNTAFVLQHWIKSQG